MTTVLRLYKNSFKYLNIAPKSIVVTRQTQKYFSSYQRVNAKQIGPFGWFLLVNKQIYS